MYSRNFIRLVQMALVLIFIFAGCGLCFAGCPDDPDEDLEWVKEANVSVKWGQTEEISVNGIDYIIKAEDFDSKIDPESVSISIANKNTAEVEHAALFLNSSTYRDFEWNYELRIYLKDIKVDSYKTPSAVLQCDGRGRPELEFEIKPGSEKIEDINVSTRQYAPGEERDFDITVKNTGDARLFDVELQIDPAGFIITEKSDFKKKGSVLTMDIDCLEKNEKLSFNFSAKAPEWDGFTSPYNINYTISASATGRDILDSDYYFEDNITLRATDPKLRVVQKAYARSLNYADKCTDYKAEIDLSPWYFEGNNREDLWDYVVIRGGVYSTGFYAVRDVEDTYPELPPELVVCEESGDGTPDYISLDSPYSFSYKLIPTAPGKYRLDPLEVKMGFFGKNFSWKSGKSIEIIVHGPEILLSKTLEELDDSYLVNMKVENTGDRAAWVNITDTVPKECSYVDGSLEESIGDQSLPLDEWEINVLNNGSCSMSVEGVFLPPSTSLEYSYELGTDEVDFLPYAEAEFRARNQYEGYVRSAYYEDGVWFSQHWDRLLGDWIQDLPSETADTPDVPHEEEHEAVVVLPPTVNNSTEVNESLNQTAGGIMNIFDSVINALTGIFRGIIPMQ